MRAAILPLAALPERPIMVTLVNCTPLNKPFRPYPPNSKFEVSLFRSELLFVRYTITSLIITEKQGGSPMHKTTPVPKDLLQYLAKCSFVSLDRFILSRLGKASNLRKTIRGLEDDWIQLLAEIEGPFVPEVER